ncbi:MAG TPA: hypothetical protein VJ303_08085, partial [Steroidobacteraceae bacterium]|nr:hypothetical protein [Steroidobacteraceae bacterium]
EAGTEWLRHAVRQREGVRMSGFEMLGDLLGGGLEARKENAFQQGRYRSAQTEDALTNARVNQAKAMQAEAENNARAELAVLQSQGGGIDYSNPSSDVLTQALLGGVAKDLPNISQFRLGGQEYRNRETLGNTAAPALDRSRASDAVQGKFEGDLQAVGTHGYYDRTDDTPELSVMAGLGGQSGVSGPIQNYNFRTSLRSPEEQALFDQLVRQDKVFSAGGVPYLQPGVNPNPTAPAAPRQLVTPAETANNAAQITGAKTTAVTQSKLASALPGVEESLDTFQSGIDDFLAAPGFDSVYGKSGALYGTMGAFAPEDYRNAKAKIATLGGEAFLNSIQKMRGLGALSNAEGERVQVALTAALDPNQDEQQAKVHWAQLAQRLERFRRVAETEAGLKQIPGMNVAPGATPPADLPPTNAKGWQLMEDGAGNKAYVGPNGEFEEVQ